MRIFILLLSVIICMNMGCNSETGNSDSGTTGDTKNADGDSHDHDEDGHDHDKDGHDHDEDGHHHDDGDHDHGSAKASDEHPAITVANQVLAAIQAGDAAAMKPLLNATNQEKVSDDEIAQYLKGEKGTIGDVTKVTEVRESSREGQVMAKIRVEGDEVFVVVLTLEEGHYRFEDINSPSVADYEAQTKIAP